MGKPTINQLLALQQGLFGNIDWELNPIDSAVLQEVIDNCPKGGGQEFLAFLRNRGKLIVGKRQVLKLDTTPFNPEEFIGKGWSFWRGPADGDGLRGDVVEDLSEELDLTKIELKSYLKAGESSTTGEERLLRIASANDTPLGPRAFQTFWKNQGLIPEEWKKKTNGNVTYIFFDKVILRGPDGRRYTLCLYWDDDRWDWYSDWLGIERRVSRPSAVLAS